MNRKRPKMGVISLDSDQASLNKPAQPYNNKETNTRAPGRRTHPSGVIEIPPESQHTHLESDFCR